VSPLDAAATQPALSAPPRPTGPDGPSVASAALPGSVTIRPPSRDEILPYLAPAVRRALERLGSDLWARAEEVRLRRGRPLSLVTNGGDVWLSPLGLPTADVSAAYQVTADDTQRTLSLVSQGSVYALEEEFRNGYVTIPGGHRVGLVGRALLENGHLRTLTHVAGLSFRLSREVRGAARGVLGAVIGRAGRPRSALIVSPPGCGKTTFLRDLVRLLSDGVPEMRLRGFRVGLVDERSEVAACYEGVPQRDVGLRTDVLDACPKAQGVFLLLRAMSPEIIAADEVGRPEDALALGEAAASGAAVLATAHGHSLSDLAARPMLRDIIRSGLFEVFVVLSRRHGPGTIEAVETTADGSGSGAVSAVGGWARA
jgi:stage III sporulation protein AA